MFIKATLGYPTSQDDRSRVEQKMTEPTRKIAYILSLKDGLPSFNFREIMAVEALGYEVHLFPTKLSSGLYNPRDSWPVHRPKYVKVAAASLFWLLGRPRTFLRSLTEAVREKALPELGLAAQFSREMKKEQLSMIHCHFADRKMFTAYFCSVLTGIPYTVTLHSHELAFYSKRGLFKKALERSARVIVQCEYNRNALLSENIVRPEKVEIIRAQAPLKEFTFDRRMKVLTVAKFYDYKGYDVLIEAARILKEKEIVFWIVGDGVIDVKSMAADLVAGGSVKILGAVNEDLLKILYQACDVFCLPSKTAMSGQKEGLPMSIMEAMAFSKPVVSTVHAGIPELVEGILAPENDAKAVAQALEAYMKDPERRNRDGQRNRLRVEKLNGHQNAEKLVALFQSLR